MYQFIDKLNPSLKRNANNLDFRKIASTLEAATRLYIAKVKIVQDSANGISTSLTMRTGVQVPEELRLEEMNPREKRRVRHSRNRSYLTNDLSQINGRVATYSEVDPQMVQLSSLFDAGNVNSLLLNNLPTDPLGEMILNSNASTSYDDISNPQRSETIHNLYSPNELLRSTHICAIFRCFNFAQRDQLCDVTSEPASQPITTLTTTIEPVVETLDVDTPPQDHSSSDYPMPFDSFPMDIDPPQVDQESEHEESLLDMLPDNEADAGNLFLSSRFLQQSFPNLARYFHKLKRQVNTSETTKRLHRSRQRFEENILNVNDLDEEAFRIWRGTSKRITFLSSTLEKWKKSRQQANLQESTLQPSVELSSFFTRQESIKKGSNRVALDTLQHHDGSLHYGQEEEDVSFLADFERFDEDGQVEAVTNTMQVATSTAPHILANFDGDFIEPLDINYAKVATKLNMKRFKRTMWDIIKENQVC